MQTKLARVVIRADSSLQIGAGHIGRCLSLAAGLRASGMEVLLASRDLPGNILPVAVSRGIPVAIMPAEYGEPAQNPGPAFDWESDLKAFRKCSGQAADLIIVDHYGLDSRWHEGARKISKKIMVIDDLSNRELNCDLLLDANLPADGDDRYRMLIPRHGRVLSGPAYSLLGDNFLRLSAARRMRGEVKRVLIFFGGGDTVTLTETALEAVLQRMPKLEHLEVIVNGAAPGAAELKKRCDAFSNVSVSDLVPDFGAVLASMDLVIGGGGMTSWERCFFGIPSIVAALAENQERNCLGLEQVQAAVYLGPSQTLSYGNFAAALREMAESPARLRTMSQACLNLVDGQGVRRVTDACRELLEKTTSAKGAAEI